MRAKNEDTKIRIYEYINEYIKNNRVYRCFDLFRADCSHRCNQRICKAYRRFEFGRMGVRFANECDACGRSVPGADCYRQRVPIVFCI